MAIREWKPSETYKKDQERIEEITGPPCVDCMNFAPVRLYNEHGQYIGVRICQAVEMKRDFSCFVTKTAG